MNLIHKLFGKRQDLRSEIDFETLQPWLEGIDGKMQTDVCAHVPSVYSDIENLLSEMDESIELLKEAKAEGTFHLKLLKVANSSRDNMIKQVIILKENIVIPETMDIQTVLSYHEKAMFGLNVCLENMLKSHQYVKRVFIEESKPIIADVTALRRLLDSLVKPIASKKNMIDAVEVSKNAIQAINDATSSIEIERNLAAQRKGDIVSVKGKILDTQNALSLLRNSDAWRQYLDSKDELDRLEEDTKKSVADIKSLVAPINSVLNRLKNLNDAGKYTLNFEVAQGLNTCLTNPKRSSVEFFEAIRKIIESGILDLKPERHDKMLKHIGVIISSVDAYKKQYNELTSEIKIKKDEISTIGIHREEKDLIRELESLQNTLNVSEQELALSEKQILALENNVELNKRELEQSVSVIDNRVKILYTH